MENELIRGKFWSALCTRYYDSNSRLSIPTTLWSVQWSSLDLTIATDSLAMFQIIFSVSCPGIIRAAKRLILVPPRTNHMTDVIFTRLQRLDVPARVVFKRCVLAAHCQHGSAPPYLADYLVPVGAIEGLSSLWSATAGRLWVPHTKTVTIGPWTSAVFFLTAWNNLPCSWSSRSQSQSSYYLAIFREKLKLHLFNMSTAHWSFKDL